MEHCCNALHPSLATRSTVQFCSDKNCSADVQKVQNEKQQPELRTKIQFVPPSKQAALVYQVPLLSVPYGLTEHAWMPVQFAAANKDSTALAMSKVRKLTNANRNFVRIFTSNFTEFEEQTWTAKDMQYIGSPEWSPAVTVPNFTKIWLGQ
jgi:hypothetical protein